MFSVGIYECLHTSFISHAVVVMQLFYRILSIENFLTIRALDLDKYLSFIFRPVFAINWKSLLIYIARSTFPQDLSHLLAKFSCFLLVL